MWLGRASARPCVEARCRGPAHSNRTALLLLCLLRGALPGMSARLEDGVWRDALGRWPHVAAALWFLAFAMAYFFAYRFGMSFSQKCASPFWFPDAILLCALLKTPPRSWWVFVLATLP